MRQGLIKRSKTETAGRTNSERRERLNRELTEFGECVIRLRLDSRWEGTKMRQDGAKEYFFKQGGSPVRLVGAGEER